MFLGGGFAATGLSFAVATIIAASLGGCACLNQAATRQFALDDAARILPFHQMILKKLFLGAAAIAAIAVGPAAESRKSNPFDFEPNPAIWKLSDEDTTIYLFGTVHVLPKKLKWQSKAFKAIVKEVDTLVVETTETDEEAEASFEKLFDEMIVKGLEQKPLVDRVAPENRDILKQLAKEIAIPMELLDLMPAWLVPFMVYYQSIDSSDVSGKYGVESVLEAKFRRAKKPILSIEDGDAVFTSLSALPEEEQLVMVNDMLAEMREAVAEDPASLVPAKEKEKKQKQPAGEEHADDISWAKGDTSALVSELTEEALGKGMYKALLTDRNAAWTGWLIKRLETPGKILVAVGAGHLAGDDSVQKMLEARGMTVKRIH